MKKIALIFGCLCSIGAMADNGDYLLKKTTGGGFQFPATAESETCIIYEGKGAGEYKVVITRTFGALSSSYTEYLSVENLEGHIQDASSEPVVTKPTNICDAPETMYSAQLPGVLAEFALFETGGCGSNEIDRQGTNTSNLKNLIDQFCPWTVDFDLPPL